MVATVSALNPLGIADSDRPGTVLLCADSTALSYPEIIGLRGVKLERLPWLALSSQGVEARGLLAASAEHYREVWVVSADDIDGINLAAALVFDHPRLPVYLICERPSGSLLSRAQSAGITATLTLATFLQRFETVAAELAPARASVQRWPEDDANRPPLRDRSVNDPVAGSGRSVHPAPIPPFTPAKGRWDADTIAPPQPAVPFEADPDPFELDEPPTGGVADQALRLSIERLRSIALGPQPDNDQPAEPDQDWADEAPSNDAALPQEKTQVPVVTTTPKRERRTDAAIAPLSQPTCNQTAMRPPTHAKRSRPAVQNGFLISVLSGSGGAGKSTVSALVAARIARQGLNVALLDCDLQFGDMAAFFGRRDGVTIDRVLEEGASCLEEGRQAGEPFIIAAPGHVEQSEAVDIERLLELVLPKFDVVVANTGAGWGDVHAFLMENSTRVLFVVDQRVSSVRACLHGLDLCRRCGIASNSFLYVLNRCSKSAPFTSIDLSCALKGATVAELKEGGLEVEELLGSGMAVELAESANPVVESIGEMLGRLLPERLAILAEARQGAEDGTRGTRRRKSSRFRKKRGSGRGEAMMAS